MVICTDNGMSCVSSELLAKLSELREKNLVISPEGWYFLKSLSKDVDKEVVRRLGGEIFGELESKLKVGEQVLVVSQRDDIGHGDPPIYSVATNYQLGVLKSSPVPEKASDLVLPVPNYAVLDNTYHSYYSGKNKWKLQDGVMKVNMRDLILWLGNDISEKQFLDYSTRRSGPTYKNGMFIYHGEEVEQFLRRRGGVETYVEGLDLLGMEPKENTRKEYDKLGLDKKIKVINELEILLRREEILTNKKKFIYSSADSGGFVENGAVVIVEDKDDAFFASWGVRERLEFVQRDIRETLRGAIELGMHEGDLKLNGAPGIVMTVPVYIRATCEKYKVEVPT